MNDWAGQVAEKADPDALWADLAGKESRVSELETNVKELQSSPGPGARAGLDDAEEIGEAARMTELEKWVMSIHDDTQFEQRMDRSEEMIRGINPAIPRVGAAGPKDRKPLLEHRVVQ